MEEKASPRRILADRDVNKPVIKSPSTMKTSPLKPSPLPINASTRSSSLEVVQLVKPLFSTKAGAAEKSTNTIGTKRAIICLGDVHEGPSQKHIASNIVDIGFEGITIRTGNLESYTITSDNIHERVERTTNDLEVQKDTKESPSLDSSFNSTEDYWNDESQNTTLTEPDLSPPNILAFATNHAPERRATSPQEARAVSHHSTASISYRRKTKDRLKQNAEALRLRLKMAMYKINTNQTDLPLSQVQIRPSSSPSFTSISPTPYLQPQSQFQSKKRKPLPAGYSISAHTRTTQDSIEFDISGSQSSRGKDICSKITEAIDPSPPPLKVVSAIPPVCQPITDGNKEEFIETPNLPPLRTTAHDLPRPDYEAEGPKKGKCGSGNSRSLAAIQESATDSLLTLSARATLELMGYN